MVCDEKFVRSLQPGLGLVSLDFHNLLPYEQRGPVMATRLAEFLRRVLESSGSRCLNFLGDSCTISVCY
jgi:hypothetical protein